MRLGLGVSVTAFHDRTVGAVHRICSCSLSHYVSTSINSLYFRLLLALSTLMLIQPTVEEVIVTERQASATTTTKALGGT
jgi:hypothetical protein